MDLREVKGLLYLLTHLSPRMCLNLGELELSVVGVHLPDLLSGRGAENLERTGQTRTGTIRHQLEFKISHIFITHEQEILVSYII